MAEQLADPSLEGMVLSGTWKSEKDGQTFIHRGYRHPITGQTATRSEPVEAPGDEADPDLKMTSFIDKYQAPTSDKKMKTRVVLSESRVVAIGHSANRAACVAISAAVQTLAAIAKNLGCAEEVSLEQGLEPIYTIQFQAGELASACIEGFVVSLAGIEQTAPGSLEVHDARKRQVA